MESFDLSRSEWENLIDQWVFKERDRAMLKRRLLDGITYERLAEEFDLSVQQTKTTIYKATEKLIKHI
jgi:DNA-directed RNA polymerase specialized sigma24 family protein